MIEASKQRSRKLWVLIPSVFLLIFLSISVMLGLEFTELTLILIGFSGFMAAFGLLGMIFERR